MRRQSQALKIGTGRGGGEGKGRGGGAPAKEGRHILECSKRGAERP